MLGEASREARPTEGLEAAPPGRSVCSPISSARPWNRGGKRHPNKTTPPETWGRPSAGPSNLPSRAKASCKCQSVIHADQGFDETENQSPSVFPT